MAVRTKAEIRAEIAARLHDNRSGDIDADDLRAIFGDIVDSLGLSDQVEINRLATVRNAGQIDAQGNRIEDVETLSGENRDKLVVPSDAEARAGASNNVRGWAAAKLRILVEAIVPAWARTAEPPEANLPDVPADGHDYVLRGRKAGVAAALRFWERPNEVPDTPGTSSGIGRLLTVIGEEDRDYAWRELDINAVVRQFLMDHPPTAVADNSLVPAKAQADTAARKKAWRDRIESAHVALRSNTLPPVAEFSVGRDFVVMGRSSANTQVGFRDITDPSTELTECNAGDVMWLQASGWTRVGNIVEGSPALQARIVALETSSAAAAATLGRMSVFEHYEIDPGGIPGTDFPEFMALKCSRKLVDKTIQSIAVNLHGQNVGNVVRNTNPVPPATDPAAPFNRGLPEASGGIINLVLTAQARANLSDSVSVSAGSPQFVGVLVTVTFTDGTVGSDLLHFGTNNNAYPAADEGPTQSQVDARVQALRALVPNAATPVAQDRFFFTDENQPDDPLRYVTFNNLKAALEVLTQAQVDARAAAVAGPSLIITNIASYDATQNRFEDSSGNEVAVPNGAIVTLTQAIYDAAVADSGFTPNANAIFLTR